MSSVLETQNSEQHQNWDRNSELLEPAALAKLPAQPTAFVVPRCWGMKGFDWLGVTNYP